MKLMSLILGVVLLSGTDALAASMHSMNRVRQNFELYNLSSYPSTQVAMIKVDTGNSSLLLEKTLNPVNPSGNRQGFIVGLGPESRGGTPDDRGGSSTTQSGGSK